MRRLAFLLAGVVALVAAGAGLVLPAGAADSAYRPPVAAPVSDPFRPPAQPWAAGNRGLDYATKPGEEVRASADGEVVFAGAVADSLHIVVLHPDGLRTSYSFLGTIRVQRGDHVHQGDVVGTTGTAPFHFGARAGDAYLDPALLFGGGPPDVHLVPDDERLPGSETQERSGLLGMFSALPGRAAAVSASAVDWAAGRATGMAVEGVNAIGSKAGSALDDLRMMADLCWVASPPGRAVQVAMAVRDVMAQQRHCTPASAPQPKLTERHIAVLVGGLGSSSEGAAIFGLDTKALGYDKDDVKRFSYRGGTTKDRPYTKADTEKDIRRSGAQLRALLERIQYEDPGVPVDILAHSQGGLVTRAALAAGYDRFDPRLPQLGAIVTMGSPHQGTDGATALAMLRLKPDHDVLLAAVHKALPSQDDPRAASIAEMAEGSAFIRWLNGHPIPKGVRFTSIGAPEDWLVPSGRTHLAGATNVTVHVVSRTAHDALPSSPAAQREVALALEGMAPTCPSLVPALVGIAVGDQINNAEHTLGIAMGGTP